MVPDREVLQLPVNWKACGCIRYTKEELKPLGAKGLPKGHQQGRGRGRYLDPLQSSLSTPI